MKNQMQISQENQLEKQEIQQSSSASQIPTYQEPVSSQPFFKKLQQVRKVTDFQRKQLLAKLNETCQFINQNPNFETFQGNLNAASVILAQKDTIKLIEVMRTLEYHLQSNLEEQELEVSEAEQYLRKNQAQFQTLKDDLDQKNIQIQTAQEKINSKKNLIEKLKQELFEMDRQCLVKKKELQQMETIHDEQRRQQLIKLETNWTTETDFIKELYKERTEARKQVLKIQKVKQLLESRIKELQNIKKELQKTENQNYIYMGENISLNKKINHEKNRKENLLKQKRDAVFNKQMTVAGQIAQEWDPIEKAAQNLMFEIISKINNNLPYSQLKDIEKIIDSAEEFYNRGGKSIRIENIQYQLQEKNHDNQKEI